MRQRELAVRILPSTRTEPCEGAVSPASIRSIVDLPAPLGPSSAVTPGPTWNETSDTATTSANHFDTCSTATRTSCGGGGAVLGAVTG